MKTEIMEKMFKAKPSKKDSELLLYKQEKAGNFSFRAKKFNSLGKITINKMADFIFNLCDGATSVKKIIEEIEQNYCIPDTANLSDDVDRVLHSLWRIGVIEIPVPNYMQERYERRYNEYTFKCLMFDDAYKSINLDSTIIAPEIDIDIFRSYEAFQMLWYGHTENVFEIILPNQKVGLRVAVYPDVQLQIFKIILIQIEEKALEKDIIEKLFGFVYEMYINVFKMDPTIISDSQLVFQYSSFCNEAFSEAFLNIGRYIKEVECKDVYLYSLKINKER